MGPDQHRVLERPKADEQDRQVVRAAGDSYLAVSDDRTPPGWFFGVVERRHTGQRERWEYGKRVA